MLEHELVMERAFIAEIESRMRTESVLPTCWIFIYERSALSVRNVVTSVCSSLLLKYTCSLAFLFYFAVDT